MAQQELEAALRREGENQARAIWRSVEAEGERLHSETTQTLEHQRQAADTRRQMEIVALHEAALSAAHKQAQICRLTAENALAQRLKALAEGLLEELALAGGTKLFQALAAEIPAYPWQRITVHRRDEPAARNAFPTAEIQTAKTNSTGREVQSADGRIKIINTLEKRLKHLWPELMPGLLQELRQMAGDDETIV